MATAGIHVRDHRGARRADFRDQREEHDERRGRAQHAETQDGPRGGRAELLGPQERRERRVDDGGEDQRRGDDADGRHVA